MKQYLVLYTVNGKGYTDTKPWIDAETEDSTEARQAYDDLLDWSKTQTGDTYDIWIEAREVGSWERVDIDSLN